MLHGMIPKKKNPKGGRSVQREGLRATAFSASLPKEVLDYLKRTARKNSVPLSTLLLKIVGPWVARRKKADRD